MSEVEAEVADPLMAFLRTCRLEQFYGAFKREGVEDLSDVEYLSSSDVEGIIPKVIARKRFFRFVAAYVEHKGKGVDLEVKLVEKGTTKKVHCVELLTGNEQVLKLVAQEFGLKSDPQSLRKYKMRFEGNFLLSCGSVMSLAKIVDKGKQSVKALLFINASTNVDKEERHPARSTPIVAAVDMDEKEDSIKNEVKMEEEKMLKVASPAMAAVDFGAKFSGCTAIRSRRMRNCLTPKPPMLQKSFSSSMIVLTRPIKREEEKQLEKKQEPKLEPTPEPKQEPKPVDVVEEAMEEPVAKMASLHVDPEKKTVTAMCQYAGGKEGKSILQWFRVKKIGEREVSQEIKKYFNQGVLHLSEKEVGFKILLVYTPVRCDGMRGKPVTATSYTIKSESKEVASRAIAAGELMEIEATTKENVVSPVLKSPKRIKRKKRPKSRRSMNLGTLFNVDELTPNLKKQNTADYVKSPKRVKKREKKKEKKRSKSRLAMRLERLFKKDPKKKPGGITDLERLERMFDIDEQDTDSKKQKNTPNVKSPVKKSKKKMRSQSRHAMKMKSPKKVKEKKRSKSRLAMNLERLFKNPKSPKPEDEMKRSFSYDRINKYREKRSPKKDRSSRPKAPQRRPRAPQKRRERYVRKERATKNESSSIFFNNYLEEENGEIELLPVSLNEDQEEKKKHSSEKTESMEEIIDRWKKNKRVQRVSVEHVVEKPLFFKAVYQGKMTKIILKDSELIIGKMKVISFKDVKVGTRGFHLTTSRRKNVFSIELVTAEKVVLRVLENDDEFKRVLRKRLDLYGKRNPGKSDSHLKEKKEDTTIEKKIEVSDDDTVQEKSGKSFCGTVGSMVATFTFLEKGILINNVVTIHYNDITGFDRIEDLFKTVYEVDISGKKQIWGIDSDTDEFENCMIEKLHKRGSLRVVLSKK